MLSCILYPIDPAQRPVRVPLEANDLVVAVGRKELGLDELRISREQLLFRVASPSGRVQLTLGPRAKNGSAIDDTMLRKHCWMNLEQNACLSVLASQTSEKKLYSFLISVVPYGELDRVYSTPPQSLIVNMFRGPPDVHEAMCNAIHNTPERLMSADHKKLLLRALPSDFRAFP